MKILPVLHMGLRTQHMAHLVIHSLRQPLIPGCLPLFTSDGLNVYFYALTTRPILDSGSRRVIVGEKHADAMLPNVSVNEGRRRPVKEQEAAR
jgi:hypothetical protein